MLLKAHIKIVVRTIYSYLFFSYKYTLLFYCKKESCCNCCFSPQIRSQTTFKWSILWGYSRVRISFSMINKRRIRAKHHVSWNLLSFNHNYFTKSWTKYVLSQLSLNFKMSKFKLQLNHFSWYPQISQTMSTKLQMRIQNPVKHLRWSV